MWLPHATASSYETLKSKDRALQSEVQKLSANDSLQLGRDALKAGDLKVAAIAFELAYALNDSNISGPAQLELARVYTALGESNRSKRIFKKILDSENLPDAVDANVRKYLAVLEEQDKSLTFGGQISAGVFYDDNVNLGTPNKEIGVKPFEFDGLQINSLEIQDDLLPKDDWGFETLLTAYAIADLGKPSGYSVFANATAYHTFQDEFEEYDYAYYSGGAGLSHQNKQSEKTLTLQYETLEEDDETFLSMISFRPSIQTRMGPKSYWKNSLIYKDKDYNFNDDRDSDYYEAKTKWLNWFGKQNQFRTELFLAGFREEANTDIYSNSGLKTGIEGEFDVGRLPAITLSLYYRGEWFDEREELAPKTRRDGTWIGTVTLDQPLWEKTLISLQYQHSLNQSNFDYYDFEKNMLLLDWTVMF